MPQVEMQLRADIAAQRFSISAACCHNHTIYAVSRPFLPRFFPFFARFHRLAEAVPTSRKPKPRRRVGQRQQRQRRRRLRRKYPSKMAKFHLQIVENRLEFQSKISPCRRRRPTPARPAPPRGASPRPRWLAVSISAASCRTPAAPTPRRAPTYTVGSNGRPSRRRWAAGPSCRSPPTGPRVPTPPARTGESNRVAVTTCENDHRSLGSKFLSFF